MRIGELFRSTLPFLDVPVDRHRQVGHDTEANSGLCFGEISSYPLRNTIERPRKREQGSLMVDRGKKPLGQPSTPKRRPAKIASLKGEKLIPFGWYGGKFSHLAGLLPLLPKCHHYCEPFAGSAAVAPRTAPSPVETYNDLDGEVVNFFRVLRDEKDKLVEAIGLTPFCARNSPWRASSTRNSRPSNVPDASTSGLDRSGSAWRKRPRWVDGPIVRILRVPE